MKRRNILALVVLSTCGCQFKPINPVEWIANRLTQTNCVARKIPPGSKWIDYDNSGGWVQLGEDGKVHPIPPSDEKVTLSPDTRPEQNDRNR
jgi:hypothetical protein